MERKKNGRRAWHVSTRKVGSTKLKNIYIYIFARRSVEIARFPREARNERRGGEREKG